mmetsp:Transcript_25667/g.67138  ORF Transcript_25667/g.67138 Transcript_25667/m.67138 type:complete len:229 (-) Transcript_25667:1713-2399(-)
MACDHLGQESFAVGQGQPFMTRTRHDLRVLAPDVDHPPRMLAPSRVQIQQHTARIRQRRIPRSVDELKRQTPQFGNPLTNVGATRVTRLRGVHGMKHKLPLIRTRVAAVLPHEAVDGDVRIHERPIKPGQALLPTDIQILDEELRHHMPHVIRHPANGPELSHRGIHHRVARFATLPQLELRRCACPNLLLVVRPHRRRWQGGELVQKPVGQITPHEAPQERRVRSAF